MPLTEHTPEVARPRRHRDDLPGNEPDPDADRCTERLPDRERRKERFGLIDDREARAEGARALRRCSMSTSIRTRSSAISARPAATHRDRQGDLRRTRKSADSRRALDRARPRPDVETALRLSPQAQGRRASRSSMSSHRMDEIARIADRATILRDGRHVITAPLSELPLETMIEHIVGRRSTRLLRRRCADADRSAKSLSSCERVPARAKPTNVSFVAHRGEVVGLAGPARRRVALLSPACMLRPAAKNRSEARSGSPAHRSRYRIRQRTRSAHGIALIPEDRVRQGLILAHIVASNICLAVIDRLQRLVLRPREERFDGRRPSRSRAFASRPRRRKAACARCRAATSRRWCSPNGSRPSPTSSSSTSPRLASTSASKTEIVALIRELARARQDHRPDLVGAVRSSWRPAIASMVMSDGRTVRDLPPR